MRDVWVARSRLLIATLWAGSLWAVGYLAAPTLFASFDRLTAGNVAATLFRSEAWLALACGTLLLVSSQKRQERGLIAAMLACTALGYFALQPFMAALRAAAGPAGVMASDAKMQFGILHGVSSVFYLADSLLGAALVLKLQSSTAAQR
ncbi:MAG: DUF4149 domain-containing protein [Burkholderiaceae bacterium]|nr:DUF4149 domain-containing protein [Burkholderiaceae bacterium]